MRYLLVHFFWIFSVLGQEVARQKCEEYSQAVYQNEDRIFSFRTGQSSTQISTCAIYENPLIIGGTPARSREFPHMAVIGFGSTEDESDVEWLCGGSLISEKHVLTAAHCTISHRGPPQKVKLGTINLDEDDDYVLTLTISRFLVHPGYRRPRKYHDIALLFLKDDVIFSEFVRPACLNTIEQLPYNQAKATGFGRTTHGGESTSQILLKVDLDIIPLDVCSRNLRIQKHEMPQNLIKGMMCAGDLKGGHDTCQGDSGGPLQVVLEDPYCMYSIIGVTSFGRFCGMAYSPGVYTKVDQYVPWIESEIWA